ncbi:serine hydrolase domain-containing protein [Actinoplanes sp. NPDC020271]|uniref:serine hydrolase domain-containing protein n=1 Tax=Actinoplanes sp. NPDC020271 TaxID=3363896 RepID=UPI003789FA9A
MGGHASRMDDRRPARQPVVPRLTTGLSPGSKTGVHLVESARRPRQSRHGQIHRPKDDRDMSSSRVKRTVCAVAALTVSMAGGSTAYASEPPPRAAVRQALDDAVAAGNPGVIALVRQDRQRWQLAAGIARPQDHWRIYSNTKSFVSTVLLQLVAERRLSLDDSVEKWLPGMVRGNGNNGRLITVRQLLNNTSGIYDPEIGTDRGGETPQEVIAAAMAHPPVFPPGQGWDYSNTNYLLAGMIIERVTHHRADQEIRRRIIEPLGLTETSFPLDDPTLPRPFLRGYDLSYRDVTEFNPSGEWTAGAMVSTVADLARFDTALFGGRLLPPAQQRELLTTAPGKNYALGVQQVTVPCDTGDVQVWETDGGGPGYNSLSMTSTDTSHQLVLVADVFDLEISEKHDPAHPAIPDARPAFYSAVTAVFCP